MSSALSLSPFASELLEGPLRDGASIGHGYVRFGDDVVAITPPGALRMPNGIEADLLPAAGEPATIGQGVFRTRAGIVTRGPLWNPRPRPRFQPMLSSRPKLNLARLPGRGPGLTPLGDDILVGYIAGRALAGLEMSAMAESAAARTTSLSATLLRLAALGQLPEAAHRLLEDGDLEPLLRFGATSGRGLAVGLALAGEVSAIKEFAEHADFRISA